MSELRIYLMLVLGTITLLLLLLNIWSKGFMFVFLRARGRRDKAQLILVNSASDAYYCLGSLDAEFLVYKDRNKNKKRLYIGGAVPRHIFGLPVWETDEEKNALISGRIIKTILGRSKEIKDETSPNLLIRTWETVEGHDAAKTDNLYERILTAPTIKNNRELIIMVAVVLTVLIVLFVAYKVVMLEKLIKALNVIAGSTTTI